MCAATTDCAFPREAEEYGKESRGFPSVLRSRRKEHSVTLIYRRCAGMDVHKNSVSVCVRIRSPRDHFETETAVFRTFTRDLEQMADWLKNTAGSDGIHRRVLEAGFQCAGKQAGG